jgi:hypothetical protein
MLRKWETSHGMGGEYGTYMDDANTTGEFVWQIVKRAA